jgi:hypothetical protein
MIKKLLSAAIVLSVSMGVAHAQQQQTPAQKLAPVLPAQPPQASNTSKPSPVGQPVYSTPNNPGYKLSGPSVHAKEPPSPGK